MTITDSSGDGISWQGGWVDAYGEISGNTVANAATKGIHLGGRIGRLDVLANEVYDTGMYADFDQVYDPVSDAIYFCNRVRDCTVAGNVFADSYSHGVGGLAWPPGDLADRYNLIEGNTITGNGLSGVRIYGGDCDPATWGGENEVRGNTIEANGWRLVAGDCHGVDLECTGGNTVADNMIADNWGQGVEATLTEGNTLVGNRVVDNVQGNATDDGSNSWDDAQRRAGNYWGDFASNPGFPYVYGIAPSYLASDEFPNRADLDLDADVDLADHSLLVQCMAGPDGSDPPTGCSPTETLLADLDDDGDVDLGDYSTASRCFGVFPQGLPAPGR